MSDRMKHIALGDRRYRIVRAERDGQWIAHALRDDTGDPFGIECGGATEDEAVARLTRWLEWQAGHTPALAGLHQAQRADHRTLPGSAFASPPEGPTPPQTQQEPPDPVVAAPR